MGLCGQYMGGIDIMFLTVDKKSNIPICFVLAEAKSSLQSNVSGVNYPITPDQLLNMLHNTVVDEWRYGHLTHNQHAAGRNKFYQDSFNQQNNRHVMAAWIDDNADHRCLLALFRPTNQPPFGHDDQLAARRFSSHFKRALHLQKCIQSLHNQVELSARAIDMLVFAVLIVNNKGVIQYLNAGAECLLDNPASGLTVDKAGCLTATDPANRNKLTALITHAVNDNASGGGAMFLDSSEAGQVLVTPLPIASTLNRNCQSSLALVLVINAKQNMAVLQLLGKMYYLSPAELRLTSALLQGKSLNEYAQETGVTLNTVRSHLKAVFKKTNTSRQSELVVLLSRVPALYPPMA